MMSRGWKEREVAAVFCSLQQDCSSDRSEQSGNPSQKFSRSIHCPVLEHRNWLKRHVCSSRIAVGLVIVSIEFGSEVTEWNESSYHSQFHPRSRYSHRKSRKQVFQRYIYHLIYNGIEKYHKLCFWTRGRQGKCDRRKKVSGKADFKWNVISINPILTHGSFFTILFIRSIWTVFDRIAT